MRNGREKATDRAARVWATIRRSSGADCRRNADDDFAASSEFWHCDAEEAAYVAGFVAGQAAAQVDAQAAWEQGYSEAASRFGKRPKDAG